MSGRDWDDLRNGFVILNAGFAGAWVALMAVGHNQGAGYTACVWLGVACTVGSLICGRRARRARGRSAL